jgi:hypothetical protein
VILGKQWEAEPEQATLQETGGRVQEEARRSTHCLLIHPTKVLREEVSWGLLPFFKSKQSIPLESSLSMTTSSPNAFPLPTCSNVQNSHRPQRLGPSGWPKRYVRRWCLTGDHTNFGTRAFDTFFSKFRATIAGLHYFPSSKFLSNLSEILLSFRNLQLISSRMIFVLFFFPAICVLGCS